MPPAQSYITERYLADCMSSTEPFQDSYVLNYCTDQSAFLFLYSGSDLKLDRWPVLVIRQQKVSYIFNLFHLFLHAILGYSI